MHILYNKITSNFHFLKRKEVSLEVVHGLIGLGECIPTVNSVHLMHSMRHHFFLVFWVSSFIFVTIMLIIASALIHYVSKFYFLTDM